MLDLNCKGQYLLCRKLELQIKKLDIICNTSIPFEEPNFDLERPRDLIYKGWMAFGEVECDYKLMGFICKCYILVANVDPILEDFMWCQEFGIHF